MNPSRKQSENSRLKVVYVLVCSPENCYYEQFLLSLWSLRYSNPGRTVELVTDRSSSEYVSGKNEPFLKGVKFHVVDVEGTAMYRSRFLKTTLREHIEGDFLFLDVDTLIAGPLEPLDTVQADIAAVMSLNGQGKLLNERKKQLLADAGFRNFGEGPYYNSGVLLVRDTAASHRLFDAWHQGWLQSFRNGVPFDQPALYVADRGEGFLIKELSPIWNCVVTTDGGLHYFRRAVIVHWISSKGFFTETLIRPHVKESPDGRPDELARQIAQNPRADLARYLADGKPDWWMMRYSDLLSVLRGFPRAYLLAGRVRRKFPASFPRPCPHPRLLLKEEEKDLRTAIAEEPILGEAFSLIREQADGFLGLPPCQRELQGRRMLGVSREVLTRVFYLGTTFRVLGDERYADRAIEEMLSASSFPDWNPAHFIDTSEMLVALSIGYDWLRDRMNPAQRKKVRNAIISKGLRPSLKQRFWEKRTNWNSVCRGGVAMGALAVFEHRSKLSATLLKRCLDSRKSFIESYYAEGGCPEGVHYWAYASSFEALMSLSLQSAFGTDRWLGNGLKHIRKSSRTVMMTTAPSGRAFSYGDSLPLAPIQYAQVWIASATGDRSLLYPEIRKFTRERFASEAEENRLLPILLISGRRIRWADITAPDELVRQCNGSVPLFIYRSDWTRPDGDFLAVKGGRGASPHGHLDGGSFVFESEGVAWATDLGKEDYFKVEQAGIRLFDLAEDSPRWELFRCSAASHNLLTARGRKPSVSAMVPIVSYWDSPQGKGCTLDTTDFYAGALASCVRRILLDPQGNLLVEDTLTTGKTPVQLRWTMCTEAEAEVLSSGAILLRKKGKERRIELQTDLAAVPFVADASPRTDYESPNPGEHIIGFDITAPGPGRQTVIRASLVRNP